jgi:CRISPR/Cas system-associated exonuclease Cas4 (RecB family)
VIEWERPDWQAGSKCRGSRPALFYPEKGEGEDATAVAQAAKAVCNGADGQPACSVKDACLEYALEHHEKFGVWGGRTERERTSLKRMRRKVNGMGRVVRTVKKSALRQLLDTSKTETRLLGAVQRHLMCRSPDDRATDVIHPSEMCKGDWCPRSTYFRIVDAPAAEAELTPFTLENVWAEGNDIHSKWQTRFWEMGVLRGEWKCNACGEIWEGTSPQSCPACEAEKSCISYREVPMRSDRYLLSGHADGDINDDVVDELCPLIEIKSIGIGTLRFDAPQLLARYARKTKEDDGSERTVVDLEALWRDIKRPFPSHVKQGMLYLHMSGRREMVFIYECKWNQQVKEFRVRYQEAVVADLLDAALDVKYAIETGKPPRRPHWAADDNSICAKCVYRETCYDAYLENDDEKPGSRNGGQVDGGASSTGARRVVIAGSSGLRNTKVAAENH